MDKFQGSRFGQAKGGKVNKKLMKHEYQHLYRTYRWQKIRKAHLEANPLCVMCQADGKIVLANVVDHIEPHKGDEIKFYGGPFQSLCKLHHDSTKQRQEKREVIIGCDESGIPIDNNHHWNK
jgi:5-methylcytosine-specific restriction enzyme A